MTDYEIMKASTEAEANGNTNVYFYLKNISIKHQESNLFNDDMTLVNRYENGRYGVRSYQGFTYDAAGNNLNNPANSGGRITYAAESSLALQNNFTTPTIVASQIKHIIIKVYGRYVGTAPGYHPDIFMAYVDLPVTLETFSPTPDPTVTRYIYNQGYQGPTVPCFVASSQLLTPDGYRSVESIRTGDLVLTADNRPVPVKAYSYSVVTTAATAPYVIPAHTFGSFPKNEMRLSPLHAFRIRAGLWHFPWSAAKLHSDVKQYGLGESVTYYHFECPNYLTDNLVYEGTVVESFGNKKLSSAKVYTWSKSKKAFTRISSWASIVKSK